jgi:hypothetical protein
MDRLVDQLLALTAKSTRLEIELEIEKKEKVKMAEGYEKERKEERKRYEEVERKYKELLGSVGSEACVGLEHLVDRVQESSEVPSVVESASSASEVLDKCVMIERPMKERKKRESTGIVVGVSKKDDPEGYKKAYFAAYRKIQKE